MSHGKAVAKNAIWLMAATAAQKVIAFITFTLIARWAGVQTMGQFFFAVSITSVFVILTDLGMTPVVIREMAGDRERGMAALKRALLTKIGLIPVAIICSLIYAYHSSAASAPIIFAAVALACFVMSADAVSLVWYGAIRGERQLRYEALGMFFGQVLTAVASVLSIRVFHTGLLGLVFSLFVGSAWNVVWSILSARRIGITLDTPVLAVRPFFLSAVPFALAGIFVKIYSYVDTQLLNFYHGITAVGYYAVAYKLTYAFQFLPMTFVAALYPGMSAAYASKERAGLQQLLFGSLRLMVLISVPIAALLSALAPLYLPMVYGASYQPSIIPMQILAWVLIPIFLDFPIGSLLNATHRAGKKTIAMGITMIANVIANVSLVPHYGPTGAAISGVISFAILFLVGFWFVRRDFAHLRAPLGLFVRAAVATLAIWFVARTYLVHLPLMPAAILSLLLCFIVLFATGLFSVQDVQLVLRWMKKEPAPIKETSHEDP
ncbi:MAG: flippase [bacterium]|nr:flippase [bacterium]